MESARYNVPALICYILQTLTISFAATALVREREHGTMEQLLITPIRPAELMLGKLIPYFLIMLVVFVAVTTIGVLWFGIWIAGSLTLLSAVSVIFIIGILATGLWISISSQNQRQAGQMITVMLMLSIMLSGYVFPRDAMPWALQIAGLALPMTHYLQILRSIILKGGDFFDLWPTIAASTGYTILFIFLAIRAVQRRRQG
jgi:ABC-2 type transport system permease protein